MPSVMSASRARAILMAANPARVEKQELVKRKASSCPPAISVILLWSNNLGFRQVPMDEPSARTSARSLAKGR